jgi:hypothetical protein
MKRLGIVTCVIAVSILGPVGPVLAATPPGNDTYAERTVIGELPFTDSVDTTSATADAIDIEAAVECGAPTVEASIWYELTAVADGGIPIDASDADYSTGVIVVSGDPGAFTLEGCAPAGLVLDAIAGATYGVVVFDYQGDGGGNGGNVTLSMGGDATSPELDITVDLVGSFDPKTGLVKITGAMTCSGGADKAFLEVTVVQEMGRFKITGTTTPAGDFVCDGSIEPWEALAEGATGKFGGGKAVVTGFAFMCGTFACSSDEVETVVRLRR